MLIFNIKNKYNQSKTQNDPVNNYEINFYRHTKLLIIKYTPTKNAVMRKITIQNTKNTPFFLSLKKIGLYLFRI